MEHGFVDLHTHTTASDGTFSPAKNVQLAKEAGLTAVAVTDHDTVAGLEEAIREGQRLNIYVVPGVEISTVANNQDIHVLGYFMDFHQPLLLERLEQLRDTRSRRNEMMIQNLRGLGIPITMDEVMGRLQETKSKEDTVGRPHIADLLVAKGIVSSMQEAFDRYLGKGAAAYVNPPRIHPRDAIDWIKDAGGAVVLAHPGLYDDNLLVEELIRYGLDGIEVYHADHTEEDEKRYLNMAVQNGLIQTAGSDFHGERNGVVFHAPIGSKKTAIDVVRQLREIAEKRSSQNVK